MDKYVSAFKYVRLVVKHKWFVLVAGLKLQVPIWRLIKHDLSKFYPSEIIPYGRQFFGKEKNQAEWEECWLKHQNRNEHHWEYWIPRSGCSPYKGGDNPLPMSEDSIREMIADWMGASRSYEGKWPNVNEWKWVNKNLPKMRLHSKTRKKLEEILYNLRTQ